MPHTETWTAYFETLRQTARPQTCHLKISLVADAGDGTCKGPNEGSGVISPGQRHYVLRMKFGNRRSVKVRFCNIECYDEYHKELTDED